MTVKYANSDLDVSFTLKQSDFIHVSLYACWVPLLCACMLVCLYVEMFCVCLI